MYKFPSINQFYQIKQRVEWFCDKHNKQLPVMDFIGRVKLHGTNVGIRRFNKEIIPQGRNRVLTLDEDQNGFAGFIQNIPVGELNSIFDLYGSQNDDITIYGEWIGKGIQSKVAVADIIQKQFVAFSVVVNEVMIMDVSRVSLINQSIYNVDMIPNEKIVIDFANIEPTIILIEEITRKYEECCPWGNKFEKNGIGEGLVWFWEKSPEDSSMWFKTKGQKHTNDAKKPTVTLDPIKVRSIEEFCDKVLTNERLDQGWDFTKDKVDKKSFMQIDHLGTFLKFISEDVFKECVDILDTSGLSWKEVQKTLTEKSKNWYMKKLLKKENSNNESR